MRKKLHCNWKVLLGGMLLVTSCSKEVQPEVVSMDEVTFGITNPDTWGNMEASRATIVNNSVLAKEGFGVFAVYDETQSSPDFMNNAQVTSADNGTTWTYRPLKYWPNNVGDNIDFYAYAPYDASFSVTNLSQLTYIVPTDVSQQKDLLWSSSDTKNKTKADGTIHFVFRHALSRIGFSVEAKIDGVSPIDEYEKVKMQVKKIVLTSNDDYTGAGPGTFYKQGVIKLDNQTDNPDWTMETDVQSYTLNESHLASHDLTLTKENISVPSQNLTTDGNYLMILPQDFLEKGFHVYVEYDVHLWFSGNGVETGKEHEYFTYTNGCVGNLKIKFEPGMAYTINLQLGLEDATLGEVTMTEWVAVDEVELDNLLGEPENE